MATKRIKIPESIEGAESRLFTLDGIATATGWERAAIVYAFTHDAKRGGQPLNVEYSTFNEAEFARKMKDRGVRGLTSRDKVRFNRQCWKDAIAKGEALEIVPGEAIVLPTIDFPVQDGNQGTRATPANIRKQMEENPDLLNAAVEAAADLDPEAVAAQTEKPKVAKKVAANKKATKAVGQQQAARTQAIVDNRKKAAAANPEATAQTDEAVDAVKAAADMFNNSKEYNVFRRSMTEARNAWLKGVREQSFTGLDRHMFGSDLPGFRRHEEEITAFVEAEDDPYDAVKAVQAEHDELVQRQMDEVDADTDIDKGINEIEQFANKAS